MRPWRDRRDRLDVYVHVTGDPPRPRPPWWRSADLLRAIGYALLGIGLFAAAVAAVVGAIPLRP